MKHVASSAFWRAYDALPSHVRQHADRCFALLKQSPEHPSLRFKQVGSYRSVRIGLKYRALAVEKDNMLVWFWIGGHAQYDKLIK